MYIHVRGSCLDKYISIALGPLRQKFLTPPLPINPSCHSTDHLKKRISSQQSSFSSSSVFLCVSSSATFFLILVMAIFCPLQLFIVLGFVFCNIIFSFVNLHVTSLTSIWKVSYNSGFYVDLLAPCPPPLHVVI